MEMGDESLAEIQAELVAVKKALRTDGQHLGMKGETLQRYFLQLNEKSNLLLKLQLSQVGGGGEASGGAMLAGASPAAATTSAPINGSGESKSASLAPAKELPSGDIKAFDRNDVSSVVTHMTDYEASPSESSKALRALSSLAYESASKVAEFDGALEQVLRLLALYPDEDLVQMNGMRAICNMAYNNAIALGRLSTPGVAAALVSAMARKPDHREISAKASEAIARVIAAEVSPDQEGTNGKPVEVGENSPLSSLFQVACLQNDAVGQGAIVKLVSSLVQNEVVKPSVVAEKFTSVAAKAKAMEHPASDCWLATAKQLAMSEIPDIAVGFIDCGTIDAAIDVMASSVPSGSTQLAGIEALSGLVGSRWAGLQAFAKLKGIEKIEAAMKNHPEEVVLQTKGIRALASGISWPTDIQTSSGFNARESVNLTKVAMSTHGDNLELVLAGLEALPKYLDKCPVAADVKDGGGVGLLKAIMAKYSDPSKAGDKDKAAYSKVKTNCEQILEKLGEKTALGGA